MSTADRVLEALQPYNLKKEHANQYRCNSPFRPGADSMSFVVSISSPEHGTFFDHHPGANPQKGTLYDLARHFGIPLPTSVSVPSSKRKYAGQDDYANAHGVSVDVLRAWGWREVTHEGRLALEYSTPTGPRWRYLDGAKPFYKSRKGYARCWYGINAHLKELMAASKLIVICNGEIATITAQHHGIPAIAVTGGEKAEIPPELLEQFLGLIARVKKLKVLIALDCDKAGRAAAKGLGAQLLSTGLDARAIDLGLGTAGDLSDFCKLYGNDAFSELRNRPLLQTVVEAPKWTFASVQDVLTLPQIEWLVPYEIPSVGLGMVYGQSGSYKSFYALGHAVRLARTGVHVLYIAAEGEAGYRQRLEADMMYHQIDSDQLKTLTFELGPVDLFNPDDLSEFSQLIQLYRPQIIIVDTFAMCSGDSDENGTRDMKIIVSGCKAVSRQLNAVIVVVHHTNAEGKVERGNKTLRNGCDFIIRLTLEDEVIAVESQKSKDSKTFEPYYFAPVTVDLGYRNNIGDPVTSVVLLPSEKVVRSKSLTPHQRRVLDYLAIEPRASITEIADALEMPHRGVVAKVIKSLVNKGYLDTTPGGQCELTSAGMKALVPDDAADSSDSVNLDKSNGSA